MTESATEVQRMTEKHISVIATHLNEYRDAGQKSDFERLSEVKALVESIVERRVVCVPVEEIKQVETWLAEGHALLLVRRWLSQSESTQEKK